MDSGLKGVLAPGPVNIGHKEEGNWINSILLCLPIADSWLYHRTACVQRVSKYRKTTLFGVSKYRKTTLFGVSKGPMDTLIQITSSKICTFIGLKRRLELTAK